MAITYQQLIDLAVEQAGAAPEDLELRAEALAINALQVIAQRVANSERRDLLRRTVTVALTNGVGTVPDTVLVEYICNADLHNPSDLSELYTHIKHWNDFITDTETRLGKFNVKASTLTVIQPNALYDPSSGLTGNVSLTASTVPQIPANATDLITNFPAELENDLIAILAGMLQGK